MVKEFKPKHYKLSALPTEPIPNAIIYVLDEALGRVRTYITTKTGEPIPLLDLNSGSSVGGISTITSSSNTITVTGSGGVRNLEIEASLLTLINSALQSNDPISSLLNDAGYITLSDVPTFDPTDYDLEDFNNLSSDPFVRQSEMTSGGATNLGYTASPTNGVVTSDTGTDATIPLATSTNAGLLSPTEKTKLEGIEAGAEVNNISDTNATDLTDGGETTLHHHDSRYYTETESDNKFVPYTGATTDVDLDAFSLNAKSLHIKGTAGQGHLGLKHQSSDSTANVNETALFAGNDGELYYKNDSLSVAQIASRAWVNAQGFITNVLTALGFTPENVANKVTSFASPNNTTYPTTQAVQTALNAKTLPLISDTPLSTVTGVNVPTILTSYQIPANTLTDYNRLIAQIQVSKSGGVGTSSLTFNLNTSNSLSGATQIATSSLTSGIQFANLDRKYSMSGTNITGYPFSASASTDGQNSSAARGSATYNRSNAIWFIIAINPASIGETHVLEAVEINARRTKTTI